ncbi:hypothetical protein [Micromonospora sp. WMMD980]|uniref:hypothetical protein n=1 Tax=Micromonospora sp. WMMD980 TaxID=3016088 RepID=UPI002417622D|nr:hypothetical protein [Micromonospora sp. WMMD980]MDG4800197.1 hypothetical protein [Micromonospora sp. WMMD980]
MSLPVGRPPYPDGRAAPSRRGGPVWWATAGILVAVAVVVVVPIGFVWTHTTHDHDQEIESSPIREVTESACATMSATVAAKAAPPGAPVEAQARAIREQDAAVTVMVARVRELDRDLRADDRPTNAWLADWETLVEARERHAADLAAGRRPHFVIPTADGKPITGRMNSVGLSCTVPPQLVDLR